MERFNLKLQQEQREQRYVALVIDKKGAKLRETGGSTESGG